MLVSLNWLFLSFAALSTMYFSRTLVLVTDKLLHGKNRENICEEIVAAFAPVDIQAVQIGASQVRVTFYDSETYKKAKTRSEIEIFGTKCKILGGGPPPTILHVFDLPVEVDDEGIEVQLSSFGKILRTSKQTYVKNTEVLTGTRIVVIHLSSTPPRTIMVGGILCRIWYKGQPMECNICTSSGHKASNCPNKDKCRRCWTAGHFARDCPKPWGKASAPKPPAENSNLSDFPPLNSSSASLGAVPSASSSSSAQPAGPSTEADTAPASSSSDLAPVAPSKLVPLMSISVPPPLLSDHPSSLPPPISPTPSNFSVDSGPPIGQFSPGPSDDSHLVTHAQITQSDSTQFSPSSSPPPTSISCDLINEDIEVTENNSNEVNCAKGTVINDIEKENNSSTVENVTESVISDIEKENNNSTVENVTESEKIENNGVARDPDTVNNNINNMELKLEHGNESNESNFSQTSENESNESNFSQTSENVLSQSSLFSTPSSQSVVESSLASMVLDPSQGDALLAVLDSPSDHVSPSPSLKRKLSPEGVVIPTKKIEVDIIDEEPSPSSS